MIQIFDTRVSATARRGREQMAPREMTRLLLLLAMVQGLASFPMHGSHDFGLRRAPSLRSICATGRGERPLHLLRNQLNTRDTAANQRAQVRVPCPKPAAWPGVVAKFFSLRCQLRSGRLRVLRTKTQLAKSTPHGRESRRRPPSPKVHLRSGISACRPRSTSAPSRGAAPSSRRL